ncbi:unnamed protein product, partial [Prorocentrum cordatum]
GGLWKYGRSSKYLLQATEDPAGGYFFCEMHADGGIAKGVLLPEGDWVQGSLDKGGQNLGFIRLRLSGPGEAISNLKKTEAGRWGKDVVAIKQARRRPSDPVALEPAPPPPASTSEQRTTGDSTGKARRRDDPLASKPGYSKIVKK